MSNFVMQLIRRGHWPQRNFGGKVLNPQGLSVVRNIECTLVKKMEVSRRIRRRDKLSLAHKLSFRYYFHNFLFCAGWAGPKNWFLAIIKVPYFSVQCKKLFLPPFLFSLGGILS